MEKTCTCEGVEQAAKNVEKRMKKENAPLWLINEHIFEILNGEWAHCQGLWDEEE